MSTTYAPVNLLGEPFVAPPAPRILVILSLGMGVESVAILVRWILEPATCPCALNELIVITAQVGDEYKDTKVLMETYLLPLMRQHGIRWVQVARAGQFQDSGIVVLDDSREPATCFIEGAFKLSDEMRINGSIPQSAKPHRCAMKAKAWPIETWLDLNIRRPANVQHAFGYNADEGGRVHNSEYAIEARSHERIAFGFNTEEMGRIGTSCEYNTVTRVAFYPLLDWGWNRQQCLDYLFQAFGVIWKKSACVYCPFCARTEEQLERQAEHPDQLKDALLMEYVALCFNPRAKIYKTKSLYEVTAAHTPQITQDFDASLEQHSWSLYRIRRIFNAKKMPNGQRNPAKRGNVFRCLERVDDFSSRFLAVAALLRQGSPIRINGFSYVFVQQKGTVFPCREELFTIAPARVEDKAAHGIPWFNRLWGEYQINLLEGEESDEEEVA